MVGTLEVEENGTDDCDSAFKKACTVCPVEKTQKPQPQPQPQTQRSCLDTVIENVNQFSMDKGVDTSSILGSDVPYDHTVSEAVNYDTNRTYRALKNIYTRLLPNVFCKFCGFVRASNQAMLLNHLQKTKVLLFHTTTIIPNLVCNVFVLFPSHISSHIRAFNHSAS